jgi:hypothetical protein
MRPFALALVMVAAVAGPARAFQDYVGVRPLAMGGVGRAAATGDAGPILNPSGMSLVRQYHVEGAYGFSSRRGDHFIHASVVDSTSEYLLAGGLYYTYHPSDTDHAPAGSGSGHEAGMALSLPFGDYLSFGGTLKYFHLAGDQRTAGSNGGFTFDVGVTARPTPMVSLAVVGANLRDLGVGTAAPQLLGYGLAVIPTATLVLLADGVTPFTADTYTGRKVTSFGGGADLLIAQRFDVRAGGGYDGASGNGYATLGFSLIGEIGAVDVGARQDVTRHVEGGVAAPRVTVVGIGLRLFVPQEQPEQRPEQPSELSP